MIRTLTFTSSTKLKNWGFRVLFLKTTVEKWAGGCIPTWSGCILQLSLLFCNVLVDAACPYLYMPLPSRGQSIVCAWREFELTSKSAEWNVFLEISNSRRRRTWFTHVRAAVWSNIIQVFYDKKIINGLVIILEVLYDGEFIWLYGNMIFMVIRCSPSWRESILWSWFAKNNCENGANSPAFHFVLGEEQLRREIA